MTYWVRIVKSQRTVHLPPDGRQISERTALQKAKRAWVFSSEVVLKPRHSLLPVSTWCQDSVAQQGGADVLLYVAWWSQMHARSAFPPFSSSLFCLFFPFFLFWSRDTLMLGQSCYLEQWTEYRTGIRPCAASLQPYKAWDIFSFKER